MSTLTNIIEARKEQVKETGRYHNVTTGRGVFYRSLRQQVQDQRDLALQVALARYERLNLNTKVNPDEPFKR